MSILVVCYVLLRVFMRKIIYLKGESVNGIEFISDCEPHISPSRKSRMALFKCNCGVEFKSIIRSILSGNTKSCGCYGYESRVIRFTKHGLRNSKAYSVWSGIKTRCYNKNRLDYKYYGERGICLSDEFFDFVVFYEYVSNLDKFNKLESDKLTIDRIDVNKNYERGNLRWATRLEQLKNRR